jgi:hypothetical protein
VPEGAVAADELVRIGWLTPPARGFDARALERAHARLFPRGFSLHVGRRPPAAFAALPADVRQAIWRDAIRRATAGRRRTSAASAQWRITAFAPGGTLTHVFVTPRTASPGTPGGAETSGSPNDQEWAAVLQGSAWRALSPSRAPDAQGSRCASGVAAGAG